MCVGDKRRTSEAAKEFSSKLIINHQRNETNDPLNLSSVSCRRKKFRLISSKEIIKTKSVSSFFQQPRLDLTCDCCQLSFLSYERNGIFEVKIFFTLAFSCPNIKHLFTSLQFLFTQRHFMNNKIFLCTFYKARFTTIDP